MFVRQHDRIATFALIGRHQDRGRAAREGIGQPPQIVGRQQWQVCQADQHAVTGLLQRAHAAVHGGHLTLCIVLIEDDAPWQTV